MTPFVLALMFALAQAPSREVAVSKASSIEGSVVSSPEGQPLSKANLRLVPLAGVTGRPGVPEYVTASNADGSFRFAGVDPGAYRVVAGRPGYIQPERSRDPEVQIDAGEHITGLVSKLIRQAVLAGHVLDEDGDPLTAASVTAVRWKMIAGQKRFVESSGVAVDADGYFLIAGLQPGHYYLSATVEDGGYGRGGGAEGYLPTWYPSATDENAARALDLSAGSELRDLNVVLRKAPVFRVRGTARNMVSGKPVEDAQLLLMPAHRAEFSDAGSHSARILKGVFEFTNVLPGDYIIRANPNYLTQDPEAGGYRKIALSCYFPITIPDKDVDGVEVQLEAGGAIAGRFSMAEPASQLNTAHQAMLALVPLEGVGPIIDVHPDPDGKFRVSDIPLDRYRPKVMPPRGSYVKSIRFGGHEIANVLDLNAGGTAALDILLAPNAAQLSGRARGPNGEAVGGVTAALWSEDGTLSSTTATDDAGNFAFQNLAPGEYRVVAAEDDSLIPVDEPAAWKAFEKNATPVTLRECAHARIELTPVTATQ